MALSRTCRHAAASLVRCSDSYCNRVSPQRESLRVMLTGYEEEKNKLFFIAGEKRETYVNGELIYSVRHVGIHEEC